MIFYIIKAKRLKYFLTLAFAQNVIWTTANIVFKRALLDWTKLLL